MSAFKTITWASIGCGNVCEVKSLPAMYKLPGSRVKGIFGPTRTKAESFALRHCIGHVYDTPEALLSDPEVEVVYVATPPDSHARFTLAALNAGKHVYVEKPMGLTYDECRTMHETAERLGLRIFVAHYRRGLPSFQKVRNLVQHEAIGQILHLEMTLTQPPQKQDLAEVIPWRLKPEVSGGGYFYDLAPHGLDIIQFVLNHPISEAAGFATNRAGLYAAEDTVVASFRTQNGIPGVASWSFVSDGESRKDQVTLFGTKGEIRFPVFTPEKAEIQRKGSTENLLFTNPTHIQEPFIQTILDELRGTGTCLCTSAESLPTALAMDAIMGKLPAIPR